jgi:uncharacterized membrane protein YgdD (TMEM256/DUF423 family)
LPANLFLAAGALFGATGVALGAFGAHALSGRLSETSLAVWNTAVTYQLTPALALLIVAVLLGREGAGNGLFGAAGWGFLVGIILFSGSLYVLALGGPRLFGPITPIGGAAFIVGWVALLIGALR